MIRHEFLDGQIYAMAGGTPEHSALVSAVSGELYLQLRGTECRPYNSDLRVRTPSGLTTYPDVTIVCGRTERDLEDKDAVINPIIVIEVLSRTTEQYDRGDKFEHYKTIRSVRQVVLVSHRERAIEVWTCGADNSWSSLMAREGERAELAVGTGLDVRAVYDAARE